MLKFSFILVEILNVLTSEEGLLHLSQQVGITSVSSQIALHRLVHANRTVSEMQSALQRCPSPGSMCRSSLATGVLDFSCCPATCGHWITQMLVLEQTVLSMPRVKNECIVPLVVIGEMGIAGQHSK